MLHRVRPTFSKESVQEGLVLPIAAAAAASGFGLLLLAAVPGRVAAGSAAAVLAVACAGVTTVLAVGLLQLPLLAYPLEAVLVLAAGLLLGRGLATALVLLAAWFAGVHLGGVCAPLITPSRLRHDDAALAERLARARREDEVYSQSRVIWARQAAWQRSAVLLFAAAAAAVVRTNFDAAVYREADVSGDAWAGPGILFAAALLVFQALAQLVALRRLWRVDPALRVVGPVGASWSRFALLGAAGVLLAAFALPADVSPIYRVNWQALMDALVQALFGRDGWLGALGQPLEPAADVERLTRTGGGGDGIGDALGPLWVLLFVIGPVAVILWAGWQLWRVAFLVDRERSRGLWRVLRALLQLPFRILALLWQWFAALARGPVRPSGIRRSRGAHEEAEAAVPAGQRRASGSAVRRLFLLLLRWAAEQGHPRPAAQTVREFAAVLTARWPERAADIACVAEVYQMVRYSGRAAPPSLVEAVRASYQRIAGAARTPRRGRRPEET